MQRVLLVDSGTTPRGGQKQTALLARELGRRGLAVQVASPLSNPLWRSTSDLSVTGALRLATIVRAFRPDVIHAMDGRAHAAARMAQLFGTRTPLVVTRNITRVPSSRLKYAGLTRYIAVSHAVRSALSRVVPADRITVIPCAVDVPLNESAANLGAGGPVIVTVAALTLEKGVDRVIRLAASARALGARWLIVGDGAERGALEQLARELNAPVTFLGWHDDVGSILRAADLMVHLPREEGLGLAVLEALARGVPVVAANVGGLPESVTTDVGTLIDPADLAVALDAVRRWLGDGARAEVARLAPAFAARFSADRLAAATIAVYADALGAAPIRAIRPIRAIA